MKPKHPAGISHTYTYGCAIRCTDSISGIRDRAAFSTDVLTATGDRPASLWIRRIHHTYDERSRLVFAAAARTAEGLRDRLRHVDAALLQATHREAAARARLATVEDHEPDLSIRHPVGEAMLTPEQVATRRRGEHDRVVANAAAEHAAAAKQIGDLTGDLTELVGRLDDLFGDAVTHAHALRTYYERRISTYLRRATRKHAQVGELQHLFPISQLALPAWTAGNNPWVAAEVRALIVRKPAEEVPSHAAA